MQIRRIELRTADGLSPLPMSCGWVRDGLFVIGMDSEFAVYSQWREDKDRLAAIENTANLQETGGTKDIVDHRNLQESDLLNIAQESQLRTIRSHEYFSNLTPGAGSKHLTDLDKRKKGKTCCYP